MKDTYRVITDINDSIFITPRAEGEFMVAIFDHEKGVGLEIVLTRRDVNQLAAAFHGEEAEAP